MDIISRARERKCLAGPLYEWVEHRNHFLVFRQSDEVTGGSTRICVLSAIGACCREPMMF
jgi:hypothetical protein